MAEQKKLTVLAVEDAPADINLIRRYLENGSPVSPRLLSAHSIAEARSLLETENVDCVLLDHVLGGESGLDFLRELRADGNDVPVIGLTGMGNEEVAVATLKAGAQDYVPKNSLNRETLMNAIQSAVRKVEMEREVKQQQRELAELAQELQAMNEELKSLTRIDPLTQISNRRHFNEALEREARRTRRQGPLSLVLIDVDCFKYFNDSYGHQKGDLCLQQVATALSRCVRRSGDVVARYGGEEFALILPTTDHEGALQRAELACEEVRALKIPHNRSTVSDIVTISVGVATGDPESVSELELLQLADRALYHAKMNGRNRVSSADELD